MHMESGIYKGFRGTLVENCILCEQENDHGCVNDLDVRAAELSCI